MHTTRHSVRRTCCVDATAVMCWACSCLALREDTSVGLLSLGPLVDVLPLIGLALEPLPC